jgi:hypothetical protein
MAMANLGDPIAKSPVNSFGVVSDSGASTSLPNEVERRVQDLLNEWTKGYFAGAAVTPVAAGPDGTVADFEFPEADLLWNQDVYPDPGHGPLIHWTVGGVVETRVKRRAGYQGFDGTLTWNIFVRVSPQADLKPGASQERSSKKEDHLCRKIAAAMAWLLNSPESRRLSARGISRVNLLRGPDVISGGSSFMRQIVMRHQYFYEIPTG